VDWLSVPGVAVVVVVPVPVVVVVVPASTVVEEPVDCVCDCTGAVAEESVVCGWAWVAAAINIEEMTTAKVLLRMIDTLHGMD
jgi:hypothetical protein